MVLWSGFLVPGLTHDDHRTTTAAHVFEKPMSQAKGWREKYPGGETELQELASRRAAEETAEESAGRLR